MNREEKATVVGELKDKFSKATFAVLTDYRGLTVMELQGLRHDLRRNDAEFKVAKNTLMSMAIAGTDFEGLQGHLQGTSAIAVSYGDPVTPAKILAKFGADYPAFEIRTAILDGKKLSQADVVALSKLPGREELLARLLSVMNAVPTGLVRVLSEVPRSFLYGLQAIKEQKEQTTN